MPLMLREGGRKRKRKRCYCLCYECLRNVHGKCGFPYCQV